MAVAVARGLPTDPRLLVVRTADAHGVEAALQRIGAYRFRRVMQVALCAGYRLAPRLYESFLGTLAEGVRRSWQNRITLIAMGSLQVRNLLSNLPELRHAFDFPALRCGMPMVVAGAGPSLDDSLPVLFRLRDRFALCAVDTALPTLRAAGLRPDLVVALEAQAANLQDFVGQSGDPGTFLAADLCSHPTAYDFSAGGLHSSRRRSRRSRSSTGCPRRASPVRVPSPRLRRGCRRARGASHHEGRRVPHRAGPSYPRSRTHARGSPSHLAMLVRGSRRRPVGQDSFAAMAGRSLTFAAGKRGGSVATDSLMRSYRDSLKHEIEGAPGRVADIGANGLALGAALIDEREFEARLGSTAAGASLQIDPAQGFPADRVAGLITAERDLLRGAADMIGHHGAMDPDLAGILHQIDYAWAHFPEYPDLPGRAAQLPRAGPGGGGLVRAETGKDSLSRLTS